MDRGRFWSFLTIVLFISIFALSFSFAYKEEYSGACISAVVLTLFFFAAFERKQAYSRAQIPIDYFEDEEHEYDQDDEYDAYPEGYGYESTPDLEYRDFNLESTYQFLIDYTFEEEMHQIRTSKDSYGSYTTALKRAKIIELLDSNDLLTIFIDQVWPMGDSEKGWRRIEFFRDLYLRFITGESVKNVTRSEPEDEEGDIQILREVEFVRGFVRAKVAVVNNQYTSITDVSLKLVYDRDSFNLDHVEPAFDIHGHDVQLGTVQPNQKKTVAIYLDPLICTTSQLKGVLHYHDALGELKTEILRPKEIDIVCPIFFTVNEANVASLRNLVKSELEVQDRKTYHLPPGLQIERAYQAAREVLSGHDIQFVCELPTKAPTEAWYYGVTKVKEHQIVMRASVHQDKQALEIFASAPRTGTLTGLLAELHHEIEMKLKGLGHELRPITNITFKDSIINRSPLLFTEGDGETEVRDSVLSRSSIGGGEPVTKSNGEPAPPAAGGDSPRYEPKAEVKKMKKLGFSESRTGNIFWIDELNIVCLQLYLYNKSFNKGTGRPHIPLDKSVEQIHQLLGKTEGAINMQVKGFSNWDDKWRGKPTKAKEASRPRVWKKWHDCDPQVLTAEANKNLELYERGEL